MEYINYTPFPTLCFETIWPDTLAYFTIVVRATAQIVPDSAAMLADEQLPIVLSDVYYGKPGASSLRYPNDLAPFKPMADIILNGSAYIPEQLTRGCLTTLKVGNTEKKLIVPGPRKWKKSFWFYYMTMPEPVRTQPIRYELAFGGTFEYENKIIDACENNPVGIGWVSKLAKKLTGNPKEMPAQQIYASETPVFGKEYFPEGYGAIAPAWLSRRKHAGTWQIPPEGECLPKFPSDFNPLFYNSAHPDLIVPYLTGDENISLKNLTPGGKLEFRLPGHTIFISANYTDREETLTAHLDTLIIEPDEMRLSMIWRATLPVSDNLSQLETRMILKKETDNE